MRLVSLRDDGLRAPQTDQQRTLLGVVALAALLGLGVAELTSRRISRMLRSVASSARAYSVADGDLKVAEDDPPEEIREVAEALDISIHTVETHRKNIKRKLGISSTAGLTRYAMEHGVLQGGGALFSD